MAAPTAQSPAGWLLENLSASLAHIMESLAGARPVVSFRLAEDPAREVKAVPPPGGLWWEQPLSLEDKPALWVGAPTQAWREIGAQVLRASGIEEVEDADARSTYLEVLGQSLSGLASSIGGRLGTEVSCEGGREVPDPPEAGARAEVELTLEGKPLPALQVMLGEGVLRALETASPGQELAVAGAPVPSARPGEPPRTLDLLMEVELPVSVSFGRAELPLKDVLKLTTGSIVELNRSVDEPVELIVNNCVIARGEVVVVEGNYGVRIKQIISPQERLRTLK